MLLRPGMTVLARSLSMRREIQAVLVLSCCRPCRYRLCRLDWLACVARSIGMVGAGYAHAGNITHIAGEGCFHMPEMRACR